MYSDYRLNDSTYDLQEEEEYDLSYKTNYDKFSEYFIQKFLVNAQEENKLYSQAGLYIILSMLCELTTSSSLNQIFNVLGISDIDIIRNNAHNFYKSCFGDNEVYKSSISNSLWLRDDFDYEKDAVNNLSAYFTEVFKGNASDKDYGKAMQNWINDKTGELLKESAGSLEFDKDTVAVIVSTLYLACAWYDKFDKSQTYDDEFFGSKAVSSASFMHTSKGMNVFYADDFTCIPKGISNGGNVWFVLPDENKTTDELLERGEFIKLINNPNQWEKVEYTKVNMSLPKFDVLCNDDIIKNLKEMGICDIFDVCNADFSPLCKNEKIYISSADQVSRIKTDEDGIEAASYTVMSIARASLLPDEEKEFNLNRPFVYAITNQDNSILFIGVINNLQ